MKRAFTISFLGAAGCHALLLFGFQATGPALQPADGPGTLEVSLVEGGDEGAAPAPGEAPPEPAAQPPEPSELPPEPQPQVAEPAAEVDAASPIVSATPTPSPTPIAQAQPAPAPVATPRPRPASRPATARRAPAPLAAPRQTGGTGTGTGAAGAGTGLAGVGAGTQARFRSHPRPEYPPQARRERQEGVTFVKVQVGADGRPAEVTLARSSGFPLLDDAAVRGVRRWTFDPAVVAGMPVASQVEIPVRFSLVP